MNKSRERIENHYLKVRKPSYPALKMKVSRKTKSGAQLLFHGKSDKVKIPSQSYNRKITLTSGPKTNEESQLSKSKNYGKNFKSQKCLDGHRMTKRMLSASTDPKKGYNTFRSTSPSLELISAQL